MQFYDEVKVTIESGKWWDWIASGRREAKEAFWWPSGGDWWNGGSIIFVASKDENTLLAYRYRKNFKPKSGEQWRTKDQYGADAEDLTLVVPVWTIIKDTVTWDILYHFVEDWEKWTALKWWEGWKWNIHFKDSVNQYPTFCLLWEPWQKRDITLELQLLADVAFIGTPSVGKSSLINAISHTKAKVAEYPFTTLIPNLWSVTVWKYNFNVIDIPWLIQWASSGKWLGNAFLRHILKSKVFCFLLDAARYDSWIDDLNQLLWEINVYVKEKFDLWDDDEIIIKEEEWYIHFLVTKWEEIIIHKKILILINKYDLVNDLEIIQEYKKQVFKQFGVFIKKNKWKKIADKILDKNTFIISAATHFGLEDMLNKFVEVLKSSSYVAYNETLERKIWYKASENMIEEVTESDKQFLLDHWYVEEVNFRFWKVWKISNPEICKLVFILQRWNDEAELWFWKTMWERGFLELFESAWISKWDILKIKSYYHWYDDRYILY